MKCDPVQIGVKSWRPFGAPALEIGSQASAIGSYVAPSAKYTTRLVGCGSGKPVGSDAWPPQTRSLEPVHTAAGDTRAASGAGATDRQRSVAGSYAAPSARGP